MKTAVRISISAAVLAAVVALLAVLSAQSKRVRHETTCTGIMVEILDSARLGFVTPDDVKGILSREYGTFMGQRLDSVGLRKIETILDGRSAILKSQAYTTGDGILHVSITQREPIVKFQTSDGGYYADEAGYVFPLVQGYEANIPVVTGSIPMEIAHGYKGQPLSQKERTWLEGIINMMKYLQGDKKWNSAISKITVDEKGDLVLYPVKGKEKFIFGRPDEFKEKFRKLEDYYRYIVPSKEEGYYASVNVKYNGQIVCRPEKTRKR